ncbi:MFS transporter [Natrarchaeobius chitinivorans]|uniref:MFS transporter n=1 Tax=Natrarchaeobius chitinivorans TaxID=1679083 RepID=A0A3N6MFJ1_NATCH|nr:MFS transporter [Natrarchaeobius chitinivorans]RQG95510.1 MFS transporter [Natrarchaeobius chitinivorans]
MSGLSRRELEFTILVSSSHFAQHVFYRVLPPLIPVLAVALEYPLWQLGLLITLYSIGMGVVQAPLGVLADRIDRRYLLPTGLALSGGAYVLFAFAPVLGGPLPAVTVLGATLEGGFLVMAAAMVIVGIGLAVVHPAGYPMITDNVDERNKGKILGFFGASSKLGDAATPAAIAGLILVLSWEQIILAIGTAGVLYGIALYLALRSDEFETMPSGQRTEGDAGVTTSELVREERRTFLYPMTAIYVFFVSSGATSHAITAFLPAFLVAVYAHSFEAFGVHVGAESVASGYFALVLLAGAATQLYLGGVTDEYDSRLVLACCMGVATVGMVALALFELHPATLIAVLFVLGGGLYGVNPARDALISDLTPPAFEGRAFGYIFTAATLTSAAFPTLIGYLLEHLGMRSGYLVMSIGTVLAVACVALLYSDRVYVPESDRRTDPEGSD